MPNPTITPPVPFPQLIADEPQFVIQATAFYASQTVFAGEMNVAIPWVAEQVTAAATSAQGAAAASSVSSAKAGEALTSAGASDAARQSAQTARDSALVAAAAAQSAAGLPALTNSNFGDILQVIDDGVDGKLVTVSSQRREVRSEFTGTTPALDVATAQGHVGTLTGNTTFTFDLSGFGVISDNIIAFSVALTQDSTNVYTVTWPSSVNWDFDEVPPPPALGKKAIYALVSYDDGVSFDAVEMGRDF